MTPEALKTFAINTGKLYHQHVDMATEVAIAPRVGVARSRQRATAVSQGASRALRGHDDCRDSRSCNGIAALLFTACGRDA